MKVNIAIYASGRGSNASALIDHFHNSPLAEVTLLVTNNPKAGVYEVSQKHNIPLLLLQKEALQDGKIQARLLRERDINYIVLAGFLKKVPAHLITAYSQKIVNIHPSLLPKHGGKGMYGDRVHQSVLAAGEEKSGITIHYVDEEYDSGSVIFQTSCRVEQHETVDSLKNKIQQLEHAFFPKIVEEQIRKLQNSNS